MTPMLAPHRRIPRPVLIAIFGIAALVPPGGSAAGTGSLFEAAFLTQNDAAMRRMMTEMAIKPSGDIDRDFVDMMVPHHQGAVDMALAVLRYGHNEKVRRLAQEIIVTQQQEIVAMRLAVGEQPPPPSAAPATAPQDMAGMKMMGNRP